MRAPALFICCNTAARIAFGIPRILLVLSSLTNDARCITYCGFESTTGTLGACIIPAYHITALNPASSLGTWITFFLTGQHLICSVATFRAFYGRFFAVGVPSFRAFDASCLTSRSLILTSRTIITFSSRTRRDKSIHRTCAFWTRGWRWSKNFESKIWTDRVVVGRFFLKNPTIRGTYINEEIAGNRIGSWGRL